MKFFSLYIFHSLSLCPFFASRLCVYIFFYFAHIRLLINHQLPPPYISHCVYMFIIKFSIRDEKYGMRSVVWENMWKLCNETRGWEIVKYNFYSWTFYVQHLLEKAHQQLCFKRQLLKFLNLSGQSCQLVLHFKFPSYRYDMISMISKNLKISHSLYNVAAN